MYGTPFLKLVADDIIKKYRDMLPDLVVVFPNNRAQLFFNDFLIQAANGQTIWSPSYTTIKQLFESQSKLQITDPIADMLTRIRNAGTAKHETVDVPASKMKKSIAEILLNEGYIKSYQLVDDGTQGIIRITLKYLPGKEKAIQGLRRVSKPGLRVYAGADELPRVLKGLGIAIVSTSKGVMTDKKARKLNVGGEVLAFVW